MPEQKVCAHAATGLKNCNWKSVMMDDGYSSGAKDLTLFFSWTTLPRRIRHLASPCTFPVCCPTRIHKTIPHLSWIPQHAAIKLTNQQHRIHSLTRPWAGILSARLFGRRAHRKSHKDLLHNEEMPYNACNGHVLPVDISHRTRLSRYDPLVMNITVIGYWVQIQKKKKENTQKTSASIFRR